MNKGKKPIVLRVQIDMNQLPEEIRLSADDNGFEIIPENPPRWPLLETSKKQPKKKTWIEKRQRRW